MGDLRNRSDGTVVKRWFCGIGEIVGYRRIGDYSEIGGVAEAGPSAEGGG